MELIVAEKPSVARDIARVLGVRASGQHCFEGAERVITWCVGHLVELEEPAAYDPRWKPWRLDTLPMLPAEFKLRPSKHAADQLRAVARLLRERRFTSVVNACDAGREGELIFRYLYQFAGGGPRVSRLWISSLTDEAIRRGFATLRPGGQLDALGDAARSRSEADWLVGMNATRAVTARGRTGGDGPLYSIGRVQTPTLAMLVLRERAIQAFVAKDYWEVKGDFRTATGERFAAGWTHGRVGRLATAPLAEAVTARCRKHGAAVDPIGPRVERVRSRTVREPAPLLFDLTALQRTANRRFGFSAARTLEIAQALYERHKVLTYPRTDSRHLTTDVAKELPRLFAAMQQMPDYAPFAAELLARPPRPSRRIVDDAKVQDHHAIIPTGKPVRPGALDRDEGRVFDLVARRFLGVFFPDAEFGITEAWVRVGTGTATLTSLTASAELSRREPRGTGMAAATPAGTGSGSGSGSPPTEAEESSVLAVLPPPPDRFLARGRVRLAAGWQEVAGIDGGDEGRRGDREEAEASAILPPLTEGMALDGKFEPLAKKTAPPRRFTEAALLGAMESAGKTIDDEALRAAMKDCGLGTPATRAAVIETLLKRDYIVRDKKQLVPTVTGIGLIEALPVASLASPELTGTWEARLARIARGEETRAAFMSDITRYVRETVDAIRAAPPPVGAPAQAIGRCPRCREPVVERVREFACTGACKFAMRKMVAGRPIGSALASVLLERGRSQVLQGFKSKAGKRFAAAIVREEDGELRLEFAARGEARSDKGEAAPPAARAPRKTAPTVAAPALPEGLICPRCTSGQLIVGRRGWGCARWREGCGFVVWFEIAGRRLSGAQLRDLITRGKTRKARFTPEGGQEIDGRLVLDSGASDGAARFEPA